MEDDDKIRAAGVATANTLPEEEPIPDWLTFTVLFSYLAAFVLAMVALVMAMCGCVDWDALEAWLW